MDTIFVKLFYCLFLSLIVHNFFVETKVKRLILFWWFCVTGLWNIGRWNNVVPTVFAYLWIIEMIRNGATAITAVPMSTQIEKRKKRDTTTNRHTGQLESWDNYNSPTVRSQIRVQLKWEQSDDLRPLSRSTCNSVTPV